VNKDGNALESVSLDEDVERVVERCEGVRGETLRHGHSEDIHPILPGQTGVVSPLDAEKIKLIIVETAGEMTI
jgi:hypothetical protein